MQPVSVTINQILMNVSCLTVILHRTLPFYRMGGIRKTNGMSICLSTGLWLTELNRTDVQTEIRHVMPTGEQLSTSFCFCDVQLWRDSSKESSLSSA